MKQAAHAVGSKAPHIVGSTVHARHVNRIVGSLQSSAPEPEPPPEQSDGQLAVVSPVSQVPLPHTAPVFEPVFDPVLLPPVPQSAGQLLTSLAAHTPSPQPELLLEASGVPFLLDSPPQLQATANESALATTHTIPDEALIIMTGIVLT